MNIPTHDGYRSKRTKGWKKPKVLEFDEDFEAETDGELSYPKRRRARWYAVDLPGDGVIEVQLEASQLGVTGEEEEFEEDEEDPFDVAFEIYDKNYKRLLRADRDDNDAGDRKRNRTVSGLLKDRYLVDLYLQRRLDEAEFVLQIKYRRGTVDMETDFPAQVAFVEGLPIVPAFDDAPESAGRCRGRNCNRPKNGKKPGRVSGKPRKKPAAAAPAGTISARIIGVRQATRGGTHITIDVGTSRGVSRGWKGRVVTTKGKGIPGGSFTISRVSARTATATVGASPDAVSGAKRVRISPP